MRKPILIDKLLGPIFITIVVVGMHVRDLDWQMFLLFFIITFTFLSAISLFKTDLYIRNYSYENGRFQIEYQRNLSKNKVRTFSIESKSINSYKFSSSSNKYSFNTIYLKYIDDDGDTDDKSFKFNNDDEFIDFVYELQKAKKENITN